MPDTIPGGAALAADGTTWIDSEGKPLTSEQIAEVKRILAEREKERAAQERRNLEVEAQRDPTARALAAALRPQAAPEAPPEQPPTKASKS